jgi:hypothetical protein
MDTTSDLVDDLSNPTRRQEVLDMLIQQQRSKERARVEASKATVENAKKNPIWERDAAWLKQKAENIRKIAVEKEREAPDYTYAPKINNKSRQLAESRKSVSVSIKMKSRQQLCAKKLTPSYF